MIHFHKTVTNCYITFAQVEGIFSKHIWASKTKQSSENRKN